MKINIEWLSDSHDCETCGGSYAEGARVLIDGEQLGEVTPIARCCSIANFERDEVFKAILEHLGHQVIEVG